MPDVAVRNTLKELKFDNGSEMIPCRIAHALDQLGCLSVAFLAPNEFCTNVHLNPI